MTLNMVILGPRSARRATWLYLSQAPMRPGPDAPWGVSLADARRGRLEFVRRRLSGAASGDEALFAGELHGVQVLTQFSSGRGFAQGPGRNGARKQIMACPQNCDAARATMEKFMSMSSTPSEEWHDLWASWSADESDAMELIGQLTKMPPASYEHCPAYIDPTMLRRRVAALANMGVGTIAWDRAAHPADAAMATDILNLTGQFRITSIFEGGLTVGDRRLETHPGVQCMLMHCVDKDGVESGVAREVEEQYPGDASAQGSRLGWDSVAVVGLNVPQATPEMADRWLRQGARAVSVGWAQWSTVANGLVALKTPWAGPPSTLAEMTE